MSAMPAPATAERDDLDALPTTYPSRPTLAGAHGRRGGHVPAPEAQKRGRNNRKRGIAVQAEVCKLLGWENIGNAGGPADGVTFAGDALVSGQIKSTARFPGWMADELAKLPRSGGRVPILAIAEAGLHGPRKRRVLIVLEAADWLSLHGPAEGDAR